MTHAPLIATTRTAADNAADLARWAARWGAAEGKAAILRGAIRTVDAEIAAIDTAVGAEEDGADVLWTHRPTARASRDRLAWLLDKTEKEAALCLGQIRAFGVEPEALR